MKAKDEKKSLPQRSEFMEQLELRTGKGIPINQIPCIYAIAHQNRCLIFGFVTLCPLRCSKFRIGAPVEEENEEGEFGISLSLEQIYVITVIIALLLTQVLIRIANIKDQRLVYGVLIGSLLILTSDYLFFKFVVYR